MVNNQRGSMTIKIGFDTSKTNVLSFLCFLLILIYSSALKASEALSNVYAETFFDVVGYIALGLIVIYSVNNLKYISNNKIAITVVILSYLAVNLFYVYTSPRFAWIITAIVFLVFLHQNEEIQAKAFQMMKKAIAISCILGIVFGLLLLLGIHGSIRIDPHASGREFISYYIVYFCRTKGYWRYCGFYNEPGALGTFCALCLCADSLNFRKKENVALLVGGFLTFSIAFIVIIGLFYAMKSATNWRRWLFIIVLISLYFFLLPNIHTGNVAVDSLINRLSFDGDGLVGDNRTNTKIEYLFNETLHSQYIFFGRKLGFANLTSSFSSNLVGPSYKTYIIDLGIVGTVLLLAPLCIAEVRRSRYNRNVILYIIITFIDFYQRAMLLHRFIYFAFLIGGVSYILQKQNSDS